MISKPFLILGILTGVSAVSTAGYFGISALKDANSADESNSKSEIQEGDSSDSTKAGQAAGTVEGARTNTQGQTPVAPNASGTGG